MNWLLFIALFAGALVIWALIEAALNWYVKRDSRRAVDKLVADALAGRLPERDNSRATHEIECDSTGCSVTPLDKRAEPARIEWRDVDRATAFKRDLFAVDLLCLALIRADGSAVELDEDMKGWDAFVQSLPARLPGCAKWESWFADVAFPAFERNETEVFRRQESRAIESAVAA
jgi:hypothetical protein